MIKKVVLTSSGIKNKQVIEHEKINDFQTYLLKDQLNDLENNYDKEEQEQYKRHLLLLVEVDKHLFTVCHLDQIEMIKQYDGNQILEMLISNFNKELSGNKAINWGMAQYLNKEDEFNQVKENKRKENERYKLEQKQIREEKEKQHQKERDRELETSLNELLAGNKIDNYDFVDLCDKYSIKLPLRTRGWALKSLNEIGKDQYSYGGNPSKVVFNYVEKLINVAMTEQAI
ncbi:hypothetical protein CIL05_07135 [Virgibacillus profundi]|uniref:Uncharacterized protein n=1 Tax=Virgibacillus profundi TaxID=2024555 RepID=A0A2A2IG60_9BACI|nr:hypothetical protein [Virgibacillus profundi]PAV30234.1 hypothetical protein CIL05_07135 [Virgibacillus profundi]PXY54406.1 hypothetical protein CIT14_07220 [Virgibacillus profundi]